MQSKRIPEKRQGHDGQLHLAAARASRYYPTNGRPPNGQRRRWCLQSCWFEDDFKLKARCNGAGPSPQRPDICCAQAAYRTLRVLGQSPEHCHTSLPHVPLVSNPLLVLGRRLRSDPTFVTGLSVAHGRDTNKIVQNFVCLPLARKMPHGPSLRTACPTVWGGTAVAK